MYMKIMKLGSVVALLFLTIYLGNLVSWVFRPLVVVFQTLFMPILLAGVSFYLFRPIVKLLSKKMPKPAAIVLLYLGVLGAGIGLISLIGPQIKKQFSKLINNIPVITEDLQELIIDIQQAEWFERLGLTEVFNLEENLEQFGAVAGDAAGEIIAGSFSVIGTLFNGLLLVFVVPFMLFYLLKEGDKLPAFLLKYVEKEKQKQITPILTNMDKTLSSYIQGVLIVCSFIGVIYYTAFLIIGLEYALLLAIIGMTTNVIPYFGPWIGAIPSVTVALLHSPGQAILVVLTVVVIQQIESTFIQPQVIGRKLSIHPVTVMALVLVAGRFIGIIGMVLVIPLYATGKVVVSHSYRLWKIKQEEQVKVSA